MTRCFYDNKSNQKS